MWLKLKGASAVWSTITGNPVSFTAKAAPLRQLEVAFSPVQDLHGYDSPWPAGGGVNKLDKTTQHIGAYLDENGTPQSSTQWSYSDYIPVNGDTSIAISGYVNGGSLPASCWYDENKTFLSSFHLANNSTVVTSPPTAKYLRVSLQPADLDTAIVAFSATPVTTYSPYSNLCPISGWDSLNVEQRGVNMWDEEWRKGFYNAEGVFFPNASYVANKNMIPVAPNTTYNFHFGAKNGGRICLYDADQNIVNSIVGIAGVTDYPLSVPSNVHYVNFDMTSAYGATYNNDISINYPATASDYQPYNPSSRSITISIGSTVYSGTVDVVTGVVTVDMASVDLGTLDWSYSASGNPFFYVTKSDIKRPADWGAIPNWLCSSYKTVSGNAVSGETVGIGGNPNSSQIRLCDPTYTDKDTFKTAMNGVQLVYELATPILIQLTPQEVQSLAGDNVVWSTANGDLTVEYRSN